MKIEKKVKWCENWLKETFKKYPSIERNHLFEMASKAKLYKQGTYDSGLSDALINLNVKVKTVSNDKGEFLYHALYI